MNLVLIGFMAAGKSAVGKLLAEKLKYPFYDTDEMIQKETGYTIAEIFANKGEKAFRQLEKKAVELLTFLDKIVISTGGGVPLSESNMAALEKNGFVVCLSAQPSTILERLEKEKNSRPLLSNSGKDPLLAVEELLNSRRKAYSRCRLTVPTDDLSAGEAADLIHARFIGHSKNS